MYLPQGSVGLLLGRRRLPARGGGGRGRRRTHAACAQLTIGTLRAIETPLYDHWCADGSRTLLRRDTRDSICNLADVRNAFEIEM